MYEYTLFFFATYFISKQVCQIFLFFILVGGRKVSKELAEILLKTQIFFNITIIYKKSCHLLYVCLYMKEFTTLVFEKRI